MSNPLVSILIPSLGREAQLERLLEIIPRTVEYSPIEVIVEYDSWPPDNQGCPKTLARAVARSKGDFHVFLGNDTIPQQGWLRLAMECMAKWFPEMDGLVCLGDSYWKSAELPVHWLASRKLLVSLGGFYFEPCYQHTCCDSELWGRCIQRNRYVHCPEAMIYHDHPIMRGFKPEEVNNDPVYRLAYDPAVHQRDIELLHQRSKLYGFPIRQNFNFPRIPRRLFTVWLGDTPMPPLIQRCVASQREYTKGWEQVLITNENRPVGLPYVESAVAAERWVNACDYLRCWLLHERGGVYLDADVELLKPFPDEMRTDRFFAAQDRDQHIASSVIGAEAGHPILKRWLEYIGTHYDGADKNNVTLGIQGFSKAVLGHREDWESLGVKIHGHETFFPYDHRDGSLSMTDQTVGVHHYLKSWVEELIPRVVYTIWLGDTKMPPLVERCVKTHAMPGWEHVLITNDNCPKGLPYVESALAAKKWVKAVDYLKFWLLHTYGGVYVDADVEILKPFPPEMLKNAMFAGRERNGWIGNGVIGSIPRHSILKRCLEIVDQQFRGDDDRNFEASVQVLTETAYAMGLAYHRVMVYPPEVFTPYDHQKKKEEITEQTVAYHHFMVSWGYPSVSPDIDLRPRLGNVDDLKVLNVGLGSGESGLAGQLPALHFKQLDHIEIHAPYIDKAKARFWVAKTLNFYHGDVRDFPVEGYDLILLFDVLEHLEMQEALALIERLLRTGARLVIFGPLENALQNDRDGVDMSVESQRHLSLWTEQDFIDLGFKTEVIPNFHCERQESWPAVWALWEPPKQVCPADQYRG